MGWERSWEAAGKQQGRVEERCLSQSWLRNAVHSLTAEIHKQLGMTPSWEGAPYFQGPHTGALLEAAHGRAVRCCRPTGAGSTARAVPWACSALAPRSARLSARSWHQRLAPLLASGHKFIPKHKHRRRQQSSLVWALRDSRRERDFTTTRRISAQN